jgi:hypothetical protein
MLFPEYLFFRATITTSIANEFQQQSNLIKNMGQRGLVH